MTNINASKWGLRVNKSRKYVVYTSIIKHQRSSVTSLQQENISLTRRRTLNPFVVGLETISQASLKDKWSLLALVVQ